MLVTPETAASLALESTVAWWPKVLQSCNTVQKEMELLCLPTSEEAALFQVIGVRETEVVENPRESTSDNVAYRVTEYCRGDEEAAARRLVDDTKGEVFRTRSGCQECSCDFRSCFSHLHTL